MARPDKLTRDLERAFAALDDGDLEGASTLHERCQKEDRQHPGVLALGAAIAEEEGDLDAALEGFRALMAAVPDDPAPRIKVAHLELDTGVDPTVVLATIEPVFADLDEEDDLIGAITIKVTALLARGGKGDLGEARAVLGELASSVIDDPDLALDLAELALGAEDTAAARRWLSAAQGSPDLEPGQRTDALHTLGHICEAEGDKAGMIAAWTAVRAADLAAPPAAVEVAPEEIDRIAQATLAELPANVRDHLAKVPILIDDAPSDDLIADGVDPRSLGLFSGTPMPDEAGAVPTVTTIHLFKKNLERFAVDLDHLAEEVRITVLHETAHYFGLDEDELAAIGLD